MLYVRSALFNLAFYTVLIGLMIVGLPTLAMNRHAVFALARTWARVSLWLLKTVCGLKAEFRGVENIPAGGVIVAPKHQSIWETFALCLYVQDFSFILKRELTWLPVFGWYLKRAEMIAINRSSGSSALNEATVRAREILAQGRQLLIFPEGTRRPPGSAPKYKYGVAHIYVETAAPCLPVALNSGLFWPRRSFVRRPGTVVVEFLPPIPPGLPREEFFARLQDVTEAATNRIIAEALARDPSLNDVLAKAGPAAARA